MRVLTWGKKDNGDGDFDTTAASAAATFDSPSPPHHHHHHRQYHGTEMG